jgi:hypothetical protein
LLGKTNIKVKNLIVKIEKKALKFKKWLLSFLQVKKKVKMQAKVIKRKILNKIRQ